MNKKAKNTIITIVAIVFIATAAVLSIILLMGGDDVFTGSPASIADGDDNAPQQLTPAEDTVDENYDGLIPVVEAKYLWEYGWQQIASEKPEKLPDETKEDSATVAEPSTYYEVVTNWRGDTVTGEDGKPVTEVHTVPSTVKRVEYITDEDGKKVTDANGKPVTEVHTEIVTTTQKPVAVTDEDGKAVTDEDGSIVTKATTVPRTTSYVTNTTAVGARYWANGVSDGEEYVSMKIILDGNYTVTSKSVMTVTIRDTSGTLPKTEVLTFNISKGTCNVSPTEKYSEKAYVSQSGGQTVVTLLIPESARPVASKTTVFKAASTLSTFRDADGNSVDQFTVSVL